MEQPETSSTPAPTLVSGSGGFSRGLVFVRGTGRCGTKSLVNQLGRHPDLRQVPINEVLPEELIDWTESRMRPLARPGVLDDATVEACRAYFEAFCNSLTRPGGVVVHKSTMRAHRLGDLLRYWPQARMIYLVRHPIPTVESLINSNIHSYKNGQSFKSTVADSLLRWSNDVLAYLRSPAFGHPRVLQVHFEDFVREPAATMDRIHAFIGVSGIAYESASRIEQYERRFVLDERERRWILESTREICDRVGYECSDDLRGVPEKYRGLTADYPDRRLGSIPPSADGVELVRLALLEASRLGHRRVGLFGAGYMARLTCPHLRDLPIEVAGLIDENPMLARQEQDGFRVYGPEDVPGLGIGAVIPLTLTHQERLTRRWQRMFDRIPVVPLWREAF